MIIENIQFQNANHINTSVRMANALERDSYVMALKIVRMDQMKHNSVVST